MPTITRAALVMIPYSIHTATDTVLKGPSGFTHCQCEARIKYRTLHSLYVSRTEDSLWHLQTKQRYIYVCFTPFTFITLRYVSCHLLSAGTSLQMDLIWKFKDDASGNTKRIEYVDIHKRYPVLRAEWIMTKYGKTVKSSIREEDSTVVKTFSPKR